MKARTNYPDVLPENRISGQVFPDRHSPQSDSQSPTSTQVLVNLTGVKIQLKLYFSQFPSSMTDGRIDTVTMESVGCRQFG